MTPAVDSPDRAGTFRQRQATLSRKLYSDKLDGFLVTHLPHIRYLTGFSGSTAHLLVFNDNTYVFVTDFRYQEQCAHELRECPDCDLAIVENNYWETVSSHIKSRKTESLAIQSNSLTCHQYAELKKRNSNLMLHPYEKACADLVLQKAPWEIEAIAQAARIADELFVDLQQWAPSRSSERKIAARLEYEGRCKGSEGASFPSIIASGPNAALPHAQTTHRTPRTGEMLLADYGQVCRGYCSDMTRTVSLGKAEAKLQEIYHIVLEAQNAALKAAKPGIACSELDAVARSVIADAGYAEYFGHGLGHGVGIEVHEAPRLAKSSQEILKKGMVVTIEPGIYIPSWGGVRIEDLIVMTEEGHRNLTHSSKQLIEIT